MDNIRHPSESWDLVEIVRYPKEIPAFAGMTD
jgi:hypothetical protein